MTRSRALLIRTAGTNCDRELAYGFERAGACVESIHLNRLIEEPAALERFDLIGIPGGFSYGDDIGAGRVFALLLRHRLYPALRESIARGVAIFAPCNGFQVLVKMGLLPGPARGEAWPANEPPTPTVTLAQNAGGRFIDDWVAVEADPDSPCIWTAGLEGGPETMMLPIAHGEGRFVADSRVISDLESDGRVALRYGEGHNLNGSMNRIAGICDASGLVFGLMPHPERFTEWTQHPQWTRLDRGIVRGTQPLGAQIFANAVRHAAAVRA